jgi:hypothetical protein
MWKTTYSLSIWALQQFHTNCKSLNWLFFDMKGRCFIFRDFALINPSCTDSIKPGLKFSCNFVVINASERSLCFQILILHNSRCQVLCGSCKKLPRTSLQCCYIFLVLRDYNASTIKCWELSIAQASARGAWEMLHLYLSLMYRLNQTASAILLLFCCD